MRWAAGVVVLFADERLLSSDSNNWDQFVREAHEAEAYSRKLWTVRPATRDWTYPADANADPFSPATETFGAANGDIAASAWSVAVKSGTTVDAWVQAYCAVTESDTPCTAIKDRTDATAMDGHPGSLVSFAQDTQAFILVQNRMYVVAIWRSADYIPGGIVPKLLSAYLFTMHLLPGGPVPSATSPSPS